MADLNKAISKAEKAVNDLITFFPMMTTRDPEMEAIVEAALALERLKKFVNAAKKYA